MKGADTLHQVDHPRKSASPGAWRTTRPGRASGAGRWPADGALWAGTWPCSQRRSGASDPVDALWNPAARSGDLCGCGCNQLVVEALACLVPAWSASRIDPMQALRTEQVDVPRIRGKARLATNAHPQCGAFSSSGKSLLEQRPPDFFSVRLCKKGW